MSGVLKPKELTEVGIAAEEARMAEERMAKEKAMRNMKEIQEAFLTQDIHPDVVERLNRVIRIAAEQGKREVQVMTFSSKFCNDMGRRINNCESDWPVSLEGFAKRGFEYFQKELKPLGYKLNAKILNFPGGMPGDVGLFLTW